MTRLTKQASEEFCECCKKLKRCHLYMLQNGEAAWICKECRGGDDS